MIRTVLSSVLPATRAAALTLSMLLAAPSQAQLASPAAAPAEVAPDLYMDAMQAISEGRRGDASTTLTRMIAQGPSHAGEWLDLALLHCALGNSAAAERLFQEIEQRYDPPKGILDIIAQQRLQGCAGTPLHSEWAVTAARGYDRNVNQGASNPLYSLGDGSGAPLQLLPDYLPKPDHYSVVSADYLRDLDQDGDLGYAQLHVRQNDHLSSYNTISLFAGAEHPWRMGKWRLRGSGLVGALTLGGLMYQTQAQLQLRATPPLTLPSGVDWSVLGSVSHMNYHTLSNFDSNTSELHSIFGYRDETRQLQLNLGWLNDHAVSDRPGGNRQGWSAELFGHTGLWGLLEGELDLSEQRWNSALAYSPGLIDTVRRQDTYNLRASLLYPLSARITLQFDWREVRNHENISIFQYDNRQIQLSLRWHGGD